jgi:hypothetical protein
MLDGEPAAEVVVFAFVDKPVRIIWIERSGSERKQEVVNYEALRPV